MKKKAKILFGLLVLAILGSILGVQAISDKKDRIIADNEKMDKGTGIKQG